MLFGRGRGFESCISHCDMWHCDCFYFQTMIYKVQFYSYTAQCSVKPTIYINQEEIHYLPPKHLKLII